MSACTSALRGREREGNYEEEARRRERAGVRAREREIDRGGKKDGMNEQTDGEQETEKENVKKREREKRTKDGRNSRIFNSPRGSHLKEPTGCLVFYLIPSESPINIRQTCVSLSLSL